MAGFYDILRLSLGWLSGSTIDESPYKADELDGYRANAVAKDSDRGVDASDSFRSGDVAKGYAR